MTDKLTNIPASLATHMNQEVTKGTTDANTPLEAILKAKGMERPQSPASTPTPMVPPTVERDGFVLYLDPTTQLFYELVKLNSMEVDHILHKFSFTLNDVNGKQIFPRDRKSVV